MDLGHISWTISDQLILETRPIAMAFVAEIPPQVPTPTQRVPSACTFWRMAEHGVFFSPADQHLNCPIGAMVMGFAHDDATKEMLMALVSKMTGCGYIAIEEAEKIPTLPQTPAGIVYGPLAEMPVAPDVILFWATPSQAMVVSEATRGCAWTHSAQTSALGRPACGAIALAHNTHQPALSLGCIGMRTFTDVSSERMLVAIPVSAAAEFLDRLGHAVAANAEMLAFYQDHQRAHSGPL